MSKTWDAVVVGSGPNGLSAAIALAQRGRSVLVLEGAETIGGGVRSAELTLPGFVHDVCSSVYPMTCASPFLRTLPLAEHGFEWIQPPVPFAHPLDGGTAATLERSVEDTAARLGPDRDAYRSLMNPLVAGWEHLFADLLAPLGIPKHPLLAARFGLNAIRSGRGLAEAHFRTPAARALFAGVVAHSVLPLESRPGAAIGLMLSIAGHAVGWPIVRGGARNLANALAKYFRSLGGEIQTGQWVKSIDDLPPAKHVFLDLTPRQVLKITGHKLPHRYRRGLTRYRYGPAVFKLDWALSGPIPWQAPECRRAATVHVGGTLDEISHSERAAWTGKECERPYVLLTQPSLFDPSRAPAGKHTAWAYCHVPNGSTIDMTARIEAQVERFAPGFLDVILTRHTMSPTDMERHNPNNVGGDIGGGAADFRQLFARPVIRFNPYSTPIPGLYICSSSTPPGGGVHGLCGYHAVESARLGSH